VWWRESRGKEKEFDRKKIWKKKSPRRGKNRGRLSLTKVHHIRRKGGGGDDCKKTSFKPSFLHPKGGKNKEPAVNETGPEARKVRRKPRVRGGK